MRAEERFGNRIQEALLGPILTLVATIMGTALPAMNEAADPSGASLDLFVGAILSIPGFVTLAGVIGATVVAGPFGFIGALLEIAGAQQLLYYQNGSGIWLIFFGAGLVIVGSFVPWGEVLSSLLGSGSRRY